MKPVLKYFFVAIITLCWCGSSFSQSDYCMIHFVPTKLDNAYSQAYANLNFKVYINDKLVTSINMYDHLKIKTYSTGRLTMSIVGNAYGAGVANITVEASPGSDVYVVKSMSMTKVKNNFFKVVDSAEWNSYAYTIKNTVAVEEDKDNPYGKIDVSRRASGKGQGTCFALSSGYVITNFHVIENAKEITVKGIDGDYSTKYGATVIASDRTNDLALLKLGNKNIKFENIPYGIRSAGIQQGEKVYAMGFPMAVAMGEEVKLTDGIISAKSGVEGDVSKFQISAAVNPGNSGGPLMDEQGNLIGVIYAKSTVAESAGYAIKAGYLETFLRNVEGYEYPTLVNTSKDKPLTAKIADMKKFIFIVETN